MDVTRLRVSLEEGERWRRTLSVTVPREIVDAERDLAVRKLSSRVRLPGFRAGKVPVREIERRYGPALEQEVLDRVIGEAYRSILRDRDLRPISEGEVGEIDYERDRDLSFRISFDVAPRPEFARTGGFRVQRPRVEVGEEEEEKVLARLREQEGTWVPAESGSPEEGERVSVRLQRLEVEGDEPRRYEFVLGRGEALPDVEQAIRSLAVGEEGEFTVSFPEDFPDEERRGQEDRLRIWLDGRKTLELPELDDAFAARVGDFASLDELRARIREDLEKEAEEDARAAVRGQLLEQLLAANPFQIPLSMVDQYIRSVVGEEQELDDEQMERAREELGANAEYAVKRFIAIDELARTHDLAATEAEIDTRVEEIAERAGSTPGEVYARLQKAGRLERLEREITERKVFEFLEAESTVTDAP